MTETIVFIVLTVIMVVLMILAVFIGIRNVQTYALLSIAGQIIYTWSIKRAKEDENFDYQKDWYKELLKGYGQVLWNPFATDIKHVFKDKKKFEEIMSMLTKEDILKIKERGMENVF